MTTDPQALVLGKSSRRFQKKDAPMDIAVNLTSTPGSETFRSGLMNDIETSLGRFRHRLKRIRVIMSFVLSQSRPNVDLTPMSWTRIRCGTTRSWF